MFCQRSSRTVSKYLVEQGLQDEAAEDQHEGAVGPLAEEVSVAQEAVLHGQVDEARERP